MFTTNKEYRRLSADRAGSHSVAGHRESTSEESQHGHAWAGTFSSPLGLVLGIHQPAAKAMGSKVCHDKYTAVFLVWFGLYFFQVQAVCFSLSMKSAAESCHPAAPRAPCPLPAKKHFPSGSVPLLWFHLLVLWLSPAFLTLAVANDTGGSEPHRSEGQWRRVGNVLSNVPHMHFRRQQQFTTEWH